MEAASASPVSDDSSDLYGSPPAEMANPGPPVVREPLDLGAKRKLPEEGAEQAEKRRKTEVQSSTSETELPVTGGLPVQIWQAVFTHLHPMILGRLQLVNRAFRSYLSDSTSHRWLNPRKGRLQVLDSEIVWATARKRHNSNIPRPLIKCTERHMWNLTLGRECMLCGKLPRSRFQTDNPFDQSPGQDYVQTIWSFAIRACGVCVESHSQKVQSLLFSDTSALLPALPFTFVTEFLRIVPPTVVSEGKNIPANADITKCYYNPHIEDIEKQYQDIKSFGPAAAEEWSKGLAHTGRVKMLDAARWERFEQRGGLENIRHESRHVGSDREMSVLSLGPGSPRSIMTPSSNSGVGLGPRSRRDSSVPQSVIYQGRSGRDIRDIDQAKASRRAEIERRCELLQPPLTRNVLQFMESFRAAVQIPMPLTDQAWEVLLPRLQAQRAEAENAAFEAANTGRASVAASEKRRPQPDSRDILDEEWEDSQIAIRERLGRCADTLIVEHWQNGATVTYINCPTFAADVLLGARHLHLSKIDEDATNDAPPQPLVLDNMKWIFDTKIRPITEKFRRDIFLCHNCANSKPFGFEAVVQHFGAKHTTAFSVGNVTVSWREAEWPDHSPFQPNPGMFTNAGRGHPIYGNRNPWNTARQGVSHQTGMFAGQVPHEISPSPRPFTASQVSPPPSSAIAAGHSGGWTSPPARPLYGNYGSYARPGSTHLQYAGLNFGHGNSLATSQSFDQPLVQQPSSQPMMPANEQWYSYAANPFAGYQSFPTQWQPTPTGQTGLVPQEPIKQPPKFPEVEVDELSTIAADVWSMTKGIKDLPQSLRVYVMIYYMEQAAQSQFHHDLDVDLFEYVLKNSSNTVVIRNAAGLACKTCALNRKDGDSAVYQSYYSRLEQRPLLTLRSLVDHYRNAHANEFTSTHGAEQANRIWKDMMLELPEPEFINNGLENLPGMDDDNKRLFSEVFPSNIGFKTSADRARLPPEPPVTHTLSDRASKHETDWETRLPVDAGVASGAPRRRNMEPEPAYQIAHALPRRPRPREQEPRLRSVARDAKYLGEPYVGSYHEDARQQHISGRQRVHCVQDEHGQRYYRVVDDPPQEVARDQLNSNYAYARRRRSSADVMDLDSARQFDSRTLTYANASSSGVQYVSRSRDWSPSRMDEEYERGDPEISTDQPSSSRRYIVERNGQVFETLEPPSAATDFSSQPMRPPIRTPDEHEASQRAQRSHSVESRDRRIALGSSRVSSGSLHSDLRSLPFSDPQSKLVTTSGSASNLGEPFPNSMGRSQSRRYGRYDAFRRRLNRTASQSPRPRQAVSEQDHQHHDLSPTATRRRVEGVPDLGAATIDPHANAAQVGLPPSGHEHPDLVVADARPDQGRAPLVRYVPESPYEEAPQYYYFEEQEVPREAYAQYRAISPRQSLTEQRVTYITEPEPLPLERNDAPPEDDRASVPPGYYETG